MAAKPTAKRVPKISAKRRPKPSAKRVTKPSNKRVEEVGRATSQGRNEEIERNGGGEGAGEGVGKRATIQESVESMNQAHYNHNRLPYAEDVGFFYPPL